MAVVAVGLLRIGHAVVQLPSIGSPLLSISSGLIATSMLVAILQDTDPEMMRRWSSLLAQLVGHDLQWHYRLLVETETPSGSIR